MGNIVIANMQAFLTLDTRQFDEAAQHAQRTMDQLIGQKGQLAGGVGQDAAVPGRIPNAAMMEPDDPATQAAKRKSVAVATEQEVRKEENTTHQQEIAHIREAMNADDAATRKKLENAAKVKAAKDVAAQADADAKRTFAGVATDEGYGALPEFAPPSATSLAEHTKLQTEAQQRRAAELAAQEARLAQQAAELGITPGAELTPEMVQELVRQRLGGGGPPINAEALQGMSWQEIQALREVGALSFGGGAQGGAVKAELGDIPGITPPGAADTTPAVVAERRARKVRAERELTAEEQAHATMIEERRQARMLRDLSRGRPVSRETEDAVSYQRYAFMQQPSVAMAQAAIGPLSGVLPGPLGQMAGMALPMMAGGALAGIGAAGIGAVLTAAAIQKYIELMKEAATAAAHAESSHLRFVMAVESNVPMWGDNAEAIEGYLQAGRELGFTNKEIEAGLSRLVTKTHDVENAAKLMALAQDMAAYSGKPLAQSVQDVMAVMEGNSSVLRQYGINIGDGIPAGVAFTRVQEQMGDAAERMADTTEGAAKRVRASWDAMMERAGAPTNRAVKETAESVLGVMDSIEVAMTLGSVWLAAEINKLNALMRGWQQIQDFIDPEAAERRKEMENRAKFKKPITRGEAEWGKDFSGIYAEFNYDPQQYISAIRSIEEEMALTGQAVRGVQEAFAAFTLFDVDIDAIREKIREFGEAVEFIQAEFVAITNKSGVRPEDYNTLMRWTDAASKSANLIVSGIGAFNAIFQIQGRMPTEAQQREVQQRIVSVMQFFKPIAERMLPRGTDDLSLIQMESWSKYVSAAVGALGAGANALTQVHGARIPDTRQLERLAEGMAQVDEVVMDLARRMIARQQSAEGMNTALVETWIANATKQFSLISAASDAFSRMRGLRVPSESEFRALGEGMRTGIEMVMMMAQVATGTMEGPQGGGVAGRLAGGVVGAANAAAQASGGGDMQKYVVWVENATKMVGLVGTAADVMGKFRGLRVPTEAQIGEVLGRTGALLAGVRQLATPPSFWKQVGALMQGDRSQLDRAQAGDLQQYVVWVENAQKMLGFAGQAVDVLARYRGLRMPTETEISTSLRLTGGVIRGVVGIAEQWGEGADMGAALVHAGKWADDATKLVNLAGAGAQALSGMFRIRLPEPGEVREVVGRLNLMVDMMVAEMDTSDQADKAMVAAGQVAEQMQKIVAVLGQGAQVMGEMRYLEVPTTAEIRELVDATMSMAEMMMPLPAMSNDAFKAAQDWAATMGPVVGVLSSTVGLFEGLRLLREPSKADMAHFVGTVIDLTEMMGPLPDMSKEAFNNAKDWAATFGPVVGVFSSTLGILSELRRLREPSRAQMQEFVDLAFSLTEMMQPLPNLSKEAYNNARDWATAMGPVVGVFSSVADLLATLRRLREPAEDDVRQFVGTARRMSDMIVSMGLDAGEQHLAARDWAESMGGVFGVLSDSAALMQELRGFVLPTKESVDNLLGATDYVAEAFAQQASTWKVEVLMQAEEVAGTQLAVFQALAAGQDVLRGLPTLAHVPREMIEGYFENLHQMIQEFAAHAERWDAQMDPAVERLSKDIQDQMGALGSAATFLEKLGNLKPNYTFAIYGFFNHLTLATNEFARHAQVWALQMNEKTNLIAKYVEQEGKALSAALDPFTKMEQAALIRPDQIRDSFQNAQMALRAFLDIADMPELQGDKLAKAQLFSSQIKEIFSGIQTTVDAVNVLNTPGGELGAGSLSNMMEGFFVRSVPRYADIWHNVMEAMALDAENFSVRTQNAIGAVPMHERTEAVRREPVGGGGGNTYNNCLIVNGQVVAQDPQMGEFLAKMQQHEQVKQGGMLVGTSAKR